jgi:hypothetical protein
MSVQNFDKLWCVVELYSHMEIPIKMYEDDLVPFGHLPDFFNVQNRIKPFNLQPKQNVRLIGIYNSYEAANLARFGTNRILLGPTSIN